MSALMGKLPYVLSISAILVSTCNILLCSHALPLCLNQEAPLPLKTPLVFCSDFEQNDSSCCDSKMDDELKSKFHLLTISDAQCGTYLNQIFCAQCDPFAASVFQAKAHPNSLAPILCNSSLPGKTATNGYCQDVWRACKSVPIKNSPFATTFNVSAGTTPADKATTASDKAAPRLTDVWKSEGDFCSSLGGVANVGYFCFSGEKFVPFSTKKPADIEGICFEKIDNRFFRSMVPHPDGSNRVFLTTQEGKILIATVPLPGSGEVLMVNTTPFLDITNRAADGPQFGLVTLAFHPKFKANGRFFVSYFCDKTKWPDCSGTCACNQDTNCTISQLGANAGDVPCQVGIVVAEYTVDKSSSSDPFEAKVANPKEVRRIFTMGFPYNNHLGGQILFGPNDHYLYVMFGDGGSDGDPFNFSQNKKSLLGKILRLDVDRFSETSSFGNYSIPPDNPFVEEPAAQHEIWAYGLRNPWRCNFDPLNPEYFYCGDIGQERFEEVDLITKGGNYGWRVYEGPSLYTPIKSPGGIISPDSIEPIFPILQYSHVSVNPTTGSAAVTGGYVSLSQQDPCLFGRYVYADVYGKAIWAASEKSPGSGNYKTTRLKFACSPKTQRECQKTPVKDQPNFQLLMSFGQDYANNLYTLDSSGVYRVTNPETCSFTCTAKLPKNAHVPFTKLYLGKTSFSNTSSSSSSPNMVSTLNSIMLFWIFIVLKLASFPM